MSPRYVAILPDLAPLLHHTCTRATIFTHSAINRATANHTPTKRKLAAIAADPAATETPAAIHLLGADTAGIGSTSTAPDPNATTGTITTPRKVYRPPLTSLYQPPDLGPDLLEGTDWLFQEHGRALNHTHKPLDPRDDIIGFDPGNDQAELDHNFQPQHCPQHLRAIVETTIKEFWDVFCEKGIRRPIRGFSFQIDTGTSPPVCCPTPRYGPH